MPDVPPEIPVEVVPPSGGGRALPTGGGNGGDGRGTGDDVKSVGPVTAFHPAAAGLMILIDSLWGIPEFAVLTWPVTVVGCFVSVFVPSYLIQKRSHGDTVGKALLKALFLGVVAAVPMPIMGTSIGLALLAWFGIQHPRR